MVAKSENVAEEVQNLLFSEDLNIKKILNMIDWFVNLSKYFKMMPRIMFFLALLSSNFQIASLSRLKS